MIRVKNDYLFKIFVNYIHKDAIITISCSIDDFKNNIDYSCLESLHILLISTTPWFSCANIDRQVSIDKHCVDA